MYVGGKRTLNSQISLPGRWYVDSQPELLEDYGGNSLDLAEDTLAFRNMLLGLVLIVFNFTSKSSLHSSPYALGLGR